VDAGWVFPARAVTGVQDGSARESAILAFGAVRRMPWVVDGDIVVREAGQLAMSFDHRLVDGELWSNVLTRTAEILQDPGRSVVYA